MGTIKGKVAVVTGAGSGIGRALAVGLARRGARVAMSDVNKDGLADTAERTRALRAETHVEVLDVTDREAVNDYAASVVDHFGVVHQLYNNAGVAGGAAPVIDCDYETYERILGINVWGVIHGTKAFLPHLINSGDGHLVNISSLNGLMAQASMSAYCTSKFAVRGFTESVRAEMLAAGHPVQVVVVHPGGIRTNIATAAIDEAKRAGKELSSEQLKRAEAYNDKLLKMSPTKAADTILNGVQTNRSRVLVGNDARGVDLLVRLLPRQYPRLGVWWERRTFGRS